jgi:hypothetical protein
VRIIHSPGHLFPVLCTIQFKDIGMERQLP